MHGRSARRVCVCEVVELSSSPVVLFSQVILPGAISAVVGLLTTITNLPDCDD